MTGYRSCATAGATVPDGVPPSQHRHAACAACSGIGYVRPGGGTYANRSQAAQARRRGLARTVAAVRCECCNGGGAHRTA